MSRLSTWMYDHVTGWVVIAAIVGFGLFGATVLPAQAERTETFAGEEGTPDTKLIYTPDELFEAAERFGEDGRQEYVQARYTFDVVWPLVYGIFLSVVLTALLRRVTPPGSRLRLLNLLPWAGVLVDYLENIATSIVMLAYPSEATIMAHVAPAATFVKWLFVGGSFVLVFLLLVAWPVVARRRPATT